MARTRSTEQRWERSQNCALFMKPGALRAVNLLNRSGQQLALQRAVWLPLSDERQRRLVTATEETWSSRGEFGPSRGPPQFSETAVHALRSATPSSSSPRASSHPRGRPRPAADGRGTRTGPRVRRRTAYPLRAVRGGRSRHSPPLASAACRGRPSFRVRTLWVNAACRARRCLAGQSVVRLCQRPASTAFGTAAAGWASNCCVRQRRSRAVALPVAVGVGATCTLVRLPTAPDPWLQTATNLTQHRITGLSSRLAGAARSCRDHCGLGVGVASGVASPVDPGKSGTVTLTARCAGRSRSTGLSGTRSPLSPGP